MQRRLGPLVLTLALVAASCAGSDTATGGETTSTTDGGIPATVPGDVPATDANGSPVTSTSVGTEPDGEPETTTTTATATTAPPPAIGSVGQYAGFYLRSAESATILVDVYAQDGAAPRQATLDHAVAVLSQVSGKTVSARLRSLPGDARQWTADEIRALGDTNGGPQSRDTAVLRLFFLRGGYAESDTVVGIAVRSDVAAVFADRVGDAAGLLGNPAAVEDAVTIHEIGHILGLVDIVLHTGREDPEHPGHSRSQNSVMYYAVESTLLGTILEGGPPRDFDSADLDDLDRIRNG